MQKICITATTSAKGSAVPEFTVPQSHYKDILALFREAKVDRSPAKWVSFGQLKIETKNRVFNYSFFLTQETTGAFRTSPSHYYRGTSDKAIIAAFNNVRDSAMMEDR